MKPPNIVILKYDKVMWF